MKLFINNVAVDIIIIIIYLIFFLENDTMQTGESLKEHDGETNEYRNVSPFFDLFFNWDEESGISQIVFSTSYKYATETI